MEATSTGSILRVGDPEEVLSSDQPGLLSAEAAPTPRGLVLKEIALNRNFEGLFGKKNEIYYLSTAMDFSGQEPVVFPLGNAEDAQMQLAEGDTFKFQLGEGAPIFPERQIVSGLAVQVHVFEADGGVRGAGEAMEKAAAAIKTDGNLIKVLKKLVANPGGLATDVVIGAVAEAGKLVAPILKANKNEHVEFFTGYWSAVGSWKDKLSAKQSGASIKFGELPPGD